MPPTPPTTQEIDDTVDTLASRLTLTEQHLRARLDEVEFKCCRLEDELIELRNRLDYLERQDRC